MYVKLSPRNLNFGLCPSHLTSTYICGMTIVLRVCGGREIFIKLEGAQPLN